MKCIITEKNHFFRSFPSSLSLSSFCIPGSLKNKWMNRGYYKKKR
jgi:hypothetical protein